MSSRRRAGRRMEAGKPAIPSRRAGRNTALHNRPPNKTATNPAMMLPASIGGFQMRILIAALLGAIAMFIWTAIAHMATPLASMGFSQMPNESAVLSAMHDSMGDKNGLYFYPWIDPKDPQMMQKSAAAQKASPHGLLIYSAPGTNLDADMGPMLI